MLSVVVIEADGLEAKDVNGKLDQFFSHSELRLSFALQASENTDFPVGAKLPEEQTNNETVFHG